MSHRSRPAPRTLTRAVLMLSAAGTALAAAAGTAAAAVNPSNDVAGAVGSLGPVIGPVKHLALNPLGRTPVDPTTNGVGTQLADFKPIATTDVTKPISDRDSLSQLPVVGAATGLLPG